MSRQQQIPLSIRIAAAAIARQQGLNREEYRMLCQRLLRQTVQTQTHQLDRMFGDSARITEHNFQRAGIGEAYTNPSQLRPGDLVWSDQGSPQYGHAMIVGTDGQLYDQVGHGAPTDQGFRHPSWIVHPDQAIASYNTARDQGIVHAQAVTTAHAPNYGSLPTNPGVDLNAPSLMPQGPDFRSTPRGASYNSQPQVAPTTLLPWEHGYNAEMSIQFANQNPANWELGPSMGQYGQGFQLGPDRFFDPMTGQLTGGAPPSLDWQSLPPSPNPTSYPNYNPSEIPFSSFAGGEPWSVWNDPTGFYSAPGSSPDPNYNPYTMPYSEVAGDPWNVWSQPSEQYTPPGQGYSPDPNYNPSEIAAGAGGDPWSIWTDTGNYGYGTQPTPVEHSQGEPDYTGPTSVEFPTVQGVYNGPTTPPPYVGGYTPTGFYQPPGSNTMSAFHQYAYNPGSSYMGGGGTGEAHRSGTLRTGAPDTAGVSTLLTGETGEYAMTPGGAGHPNAPWWNMYHTPHPSRASFLNHLDYQNPLGQDPSRALHSGTFALLHQGT